MKKLMTSYFLVFNCICLLSQISWEVLPAKNYEAIQSKSDYVFGYNFTVLNDDKIFVNREKRNNGPYLYDPNDSIFHKINYKNPLYGRNKAISLPNGNLIYAADNYISKDGGLTWAPVKNDFLDQDKGSSRIYRSIHFKDNILYWLSNKAIHISSDYGENINGWMWSRDKQKVRRGQDTLKVIGLRGDVRGISSEGYVYHLGKDNRELYLRITNLKGYQLDYFRVNSEYNYPLDIETSYKGNMIYIAAYNKEDESRIFKSKGHSSAFQEIEIKEMTGVEEIDIIVDRLENVYLLTQNQVWMSRDEGNTWSNITPSNQNFIKPVELKLAHNNHLYLSSDGIPLLKSKQKIN